MNEWFRNQTILKYQYQELGKGKVYVLKQSIVRWDDTFLKLQDIQT